MNSTALTRSLLVVLLSLLTLTVPITPAGAQTVPAKTYTFTVNTTHDTHDAHPGDGKCADKQGKCSLRAAIEEADALPSGSSITITLPKGTYKLKLGTLKLMGTHSITITGASSKTTVIKGNHTFGIIRIAATVSAHLSRLTISGGEAYANYGNGGGIENFGTLSVSESTLSGNTAYGSGGGIANGNVDVPGGTVIVSESTLSGNRYYTFGGGISNENGGTVIVKNSTLSNNKAGDSTGGAGGAIYNSGGRVIVITSTLSNNFAVYSGGGIFTYDSTLIVSESTISNNLAEHFRDPGHGGGIYIDGGRVTVKNSTFSGNSANGGCNCGYGGGIDNSGTLAVSNSTFSGNSVTGNPSYGGAIYNGGALSVSSSTFSGNTAGLKGGGIYNGSFATVTGTIMANSGQGGNCAGPIKETVGYNLDSDGSCDFHLRTDLTKTNPKLGPLRNNGGPTQTMALRKGSPAIDWVAASSGPATDQRGYPRPDNSESTCDIGAYESSY